MASVEELLEKARRLDLSGIEGRFRLGEIVEALRRQLPAAADLHDRLAIDLEVDRDTITEAWFVASAFPPATRRPGLPWTTYLILRFHPERHELVDRAASAAGIRPGSSRSCRLALPPTTAARQTSPHRLRWTAYRNRAPAADPRPLGRGSCCRRGRPMSPRSGSVPQMILDAR